MAPRILLCCLVPRPRRLRRGRAGATTASRARQAGVGDQLAVRVDPDGKGPEPARQAEIAAMRTATARAARPRRACARPTSSRHPADVACTEQFGGPQTAKVYGSLDRRAHRGDLRPQRRLRDRPLGQARRAAGAGGLMAYRVVLRHGPKVDKHGARRRSTPRSALLEQRARAAAAARARRDGRPARAPLRAGAAGRRARASCAAPGGCARASTSAATAPPRPGPGRMRRRVVEQRDGEDAYAALRRVLSRARASSRSGAASRRARASRARATPAAPRSAASGPSPRGGRPRARSRSRARPRAPAAGAS